MEGTPRAMLPLDQLEIRLREKEKVVIEEAMKVIQENARDGCLFKEAAEKGYLNVVEFFLEARMHYNLSPKEFLRCSNTGAADPNGCTPLHLAALHGNVEIMDCILSYGKLPNKRRREEDSVFYEYVQSKCGSNFKLFRGRGASFWRHSTPLHIACRHKNIELVRFILGQQRNKKSENSTAATTSSSTCKHTTQISVINNFDKSGRTPLHCATSFVLQKILIENGADPCIPDKHGRSLLHKASNDQYAKFLLQQGVLVDARDRYGYTPLHCALLDGNTNVAKVLIHYGASSNSRNGFGSTPLSLSLDNKDYSFVRLLLENDADVNSRFDMDKFHSPLNSVASYNQSTLLHLQVQNGHATAVKILLEHGANVNAVDDEGRTPFHYAATEEIKKLLIDNGANPTIRDKHGETARQYFAGFSDSEDD